LAALLVGALMFGFVLLAVTHNDAVSCVCCSFHRYARKFDLLLLMFKIIHQ